MIHVLILFWICHWFYATSFSWVIQVMVVRIIFDQDVFAVIYNGWFIVESRLHTTLGAINLVLSVTMLSWRN